jgi:glycosyltransferase involved in cell wall biosynthesis
MEAKNIFKEWPRENYQILQMKSKKKPEISIIMNCYNGEQYLRKSLSSIINQTYKNWELIFWDNCSTDQSKKIFKTFKDKRLKYFKSNKYQKLYKARNNAIKKSKGRYISFIDTDDWWLKNRLAKQLSFIRSKSRDKCKIIYSNWFTYNQKKGIKRIFNNTKLPSGKITQELLNKYEMNIGTVLICKSIFDDLKFNEKYEIIGDFDFFIKASFKYKLFSMQEPLSYYRLHDNNFSKKFKLHFSELSNWLENNKKRFSNRNLNYQNQILYLNKLKIKSILNFGKI